MPNLYDFIPWQSKALSIGNYGLGGIPNITGRYNTDIGQYVRPWLTECQGAFLPIDYSSTDSNDPNPGTSYNKAHYLTFDASRCSSVYVNGIDRIVAAYCTVYYIIEY